MTDGQAKNFKRLGIAKERWRLNRERHVISDSESPSAGVLKCEEIDIPFEFGRDSRWI